VLTQRLNRLTQEGILDKVPYQDRPLCHEYRLTAKGRAFFGVLMAMMRWGDDWLAPSNGAPIEIVDRASGEVILALVVDEKTGQPLDTRNITVRPGPGFPADLAVPDYLGAHDQSDASKIP
jgi:hypothetical protein